MNHRALTTVVVPAHNAEDYLARTLLSALRQTYAELEIIVVNDGSTDSTREIAEETALQDKRVQLISTRNGGVARARNVGLEAASGQFVSFLDADDLWHPEKIQSQVEAMQGNGSGDFAAAYSRKRIIDWEDRVIRNGGGILCSGHVLARHMFARPVGNGSALLVRRDVAREIGGYNPEWLDRGVGGCEDIDFEFRVAEKYPIVAVPRYLVGYRSHAGNMSSNHLALARAIIATVDHHVGLHPELPAWVQRKICASSLESALQNIANANEWTLFLKQLLRLYSMDFRRGGAFTARLLARKFLRPLPGFREVMPESRPMFYELSPDDEAEPYRQFPRKRDLHLMKKLEVVDHDRARTLPVTSSLGHESKGL